MAETEKHIFSRRTALKIAGVGAGAALVASEAEKILYPTVSLKHADFIMIPERHTNDAQLSALPSDTDVWYTEHADRVDSSGIAFYKPDVTLEELLDDFNGKISANGIPLYLGVMDDSYLELYKESFKDQRKFLEQGNMVAWSDLDIDITGLKKYFSATDVDDLTKREMVTRIATTVGALTTLLDTMVEKIRKIDRRRFIFKAGLASLLVGVTQSIHISSSRDLANSGFDGITVTTVDRLQSRLKALVEHMAPYDLQIFFRNVFVATQLLTLGEVLHTQNEKRPKIAINYGAFHGGIEDFLRLGKDVCVALLSVYPTEIWEELAATHGGAETLSSIATVTLEEQAVSQNMVINQDLLQMLQKKLSEDNNQIASN